MYTVCRSDCHVKVSVLCSVLLFAVWDENLHALSLQLQPNVGPHLASRTETANVNPNLCKQVCLAWVSVAFIVSVWLDSNEFSYIGWWWLVKWLSAHRFPYVQVWLLSLQWVKVVSVLLAESCNKLYHKALLDNTDLGQVVRHKCILQTDWRGVQIDRLDWDVVIQAGCLLAVHAFVSIFWVCLQLCADVMAWDTLLWSVVVNYLF